MYIKKIYIESIYKLNLKNILIYKYLIIYLFIFVKIYDLTTHYIKSL